MSILYQIQSIWLVAITNKPHSMGHALLVGGLDTRQNNVIIWPFSYFFLGMSNLLMQMRSRPSKSVGLTRTRNGLALMLNPPLKVAASYLGASGLTVNQVDAEIDREFFIDTKDTDLAIECRGRGPGAPVPSSFW
jgi:hypothetical protein